MEESVKKSKTLWDVEEETFLHVETNDKNTGTGKGQYPNRWETSASKADDVLKNHSGGDLSHQNSLPQDSHRIRQHGGTTGENVKKRKTLWDVGEEPILHVETHDKSVLSGKGHHSNSWETGASKAGDSLKNQSGYDLSHQNSQRIRQHGGTMGENVKRLKTLPDGEEEAFLHVEANDEHVWTGKGHPNCWETGDSKADDSLKNHSGYDLSHQNSLPQDSDRIRQHGERVPETEEVDGKKGLYHNMSPSFDGHGRQHEELDRKKDFYNSMSPSFDGRRKKTGSRSPDHRSIQPRRNSARDRSRSRGRGEGRSRSPSRRRDRDKYQVQKRSGSRSWSGSPARNYKGDPYGWSDRRNGSRISSQTCRDFATGKCRKGSECRFLHPDNFKNTDRHQIDDNMAVRLGNRLEHGHASSYANSEGHNIPNKLPDAYNMEHDRTGKHNRVMITCKDFIKGKCQWGASCKFLHNGNYERGNKNAPLSFIHERESSKSYKQLCKYFAAGRCLHENCKFSHDGPTPSYVDVRSSDPIERHPKILRGTNLDDAQRDSKVSQIERHPKIFIASPNGRHTNTSQSAPKKSIDGEEQNATSIASRPQYSDGSSHVHIQDRIQDNSGFDLPKTTVIEPEIPSQAFVMPCTYQDSIKSGSNVPNEVKNSNIGVHPATFPGQSYQVGESRTACSEPSLFISLDQSRQMNHKEAACTTDTPSMEVSYNVSSDVFSKLASQMKNSPTSPTMKFENESAKCEVPTVLLPSSYKEVASSDPNSALPAQHQAPGDGVELHTSVNGMASLVNRSDLDEQRSKVPLEQPEIGIDLEVNRNDKKVANKRDDGQENKHRDNVEGHGKVEEVSSNKDEKAIRLFKNALIEFVKEILKPTWKEGRMSKEEHKTIVKKVVDKVTSTIQGDHVPKTQEKVEQYLTYSKAKLNKLVQAYVERCLKADT